MATAKSQKISVNQIKALRESIESQLQSNLADDGTIDLLKLRENNPPLAEIFDVITLSKTWRDDPMAFSKDVARMMSARDDSSTLGAALQKLEAKLAKKSK